MRHTPGRIASLLAVLLAVLGLAAGCSKPTKPSYGTVRVSLTDAPADFDSVILVIREVAIHREGPDDTGWSSFVPDSSRYDLLRLRNGVMAELGALPVDAGHYTQVRLVLGAGSYVIENGLRRDLTVPSGMQTGLKLIGEFDVAAGTTVDLGIDFDAARSIHETGSSKLMLRPTARVMVMPLTGAITGTVSPADPPSVAYAIAGPDTLASAVPDAAGAFRLALLAPGGYTVAIDAPAAWRDTSLAGVGVTAGQVTALGSIVLTPQ
jgi:hypothetical protein